MYKLLLIRQYLLKRRLAWISLFAVALCTAMVLVVISVMGGWLRMFQDLNHKLVGDIVVSDTSFQGFGHYEEMLQKIRALPEVNGAVPVIQTYGLLNVDGQIPEAVQVIAYGDLQDIDKVNGFHESLYRQYKKPMEHIIADKSLTNQQRQAMIDQLDQTPPNFDKPLSPEEYMFAYEEQQNPSATFPLKSVANWPGMICGVGTIGITRDANGNWKRGAYMNQVYQAWATLTLLDMRDSGGMMGMDMTPHPFWVADDSRTGLFAVDSKTVYVPFDALQEALGMEAQQYTSMSDHKQHTEPALANQIQIGCKPGTNLEALAEKIKANVLPIYLKGEGTVPQHLMVETWDEQQAPFLEAVENEKVLEIILFGIISVVSIFLIFCIFFMIVAEKTRDIGIIKSIGATGSGVAGIFLGYGLTIGIFGGGLGLLFAYLIVHNINGLQDWVALEFGVRIWNPQTYVFDTIPNTMDPHDVAVIVGVAIFSALVGALVPAIRAARMHPVEALRWE